MYACAETLACVRACARARLCLCDDLGTYSKTNKRTPFLNNLAPLCSDGTSPVGSSVAFSIIERFGHQSSPEANGFFAGGGGAYWAILGRTHHKPPTRKRLARCRLRVVGG